jgi:hypothetical protein
MFLVGILHSEPYDQCQANEELIQLQRLNHEEVPCGVSSWDLRLMFLRVSDGGTSKQLLDCCVM